ncbi:MAG: DUF4832 domain-containing protein, partial [Candidatus Eisenbacteria bacterium]
MWTSCVSFGSLCPSPLLHRDWDATDVGTYGVWVTIAQDKAYLAEETKSVPMGGETCKITPPGDPPPPRAECPTALTELAQFHWSYLNVETGAG